MAGVDFPIICPRLVGRDEELAALEAFVRERNPSRGNSILVSGEAGIGKSRLASTLRQSLLEQGWDVLEMSCYEQDASLPFAGIIDLMRRLGRRDSAFVDAHVLPVADAFASLMPELVPSSSVTAAAGDPAQEKERILAALLQFLASVTAEKPCLIVVEDLHWSDAGTLAALLHLARNTREQSLTLMMTLRQGDASPEVQSFIAELDRERLSARLQLKRLTLSETDEMVKAIFGTSRSTRMDLLHGLYRLTEGNPFFVEEVLRSLLSGGPSADPATIRIDHAAIPGTIQEVVGQRLESLSTPARSILELAAVAGVKFELELLEAMSGLDEAALLAGLHELIESQLVVESDDDAFAFQHALTREAVASGLLKRERARLHAGIADHIESHGGEGERPEDLSYHFFEAGVWDKARKYAQLSGARALAMNAPAIALEHFSRAIEAASRDHEEASSATYRGRAAALEALGDFEQARADFEYAILLAERDDDAPALIDGLLGLGLLWSSRDYARALPCYERAVDIARTLPDRGYLARSLGRLANGLTNTDSFDRALTYLQEALAIYRESDDQRGVAETLDLIGMTGLMGGRLAESLAAYRESLGLLEAQDDKRSLISILASIPVLSGTYQTAMLAPALSLLDARPYAERALHLARDLGVPSDLSYALWQNGFWLGAQGRYREAFFLAQEALRLAIEADHKQWQAASRCVLGALYTDVLDAQAAEQELRGALALGREMGSALWDAQMSNLLVDALLQQGRVQDAASVVAGFDREHDPPGSMLDVWLMAAVAEVAFAQEDFPRARGIIEAITGTRAPGLKLDRLRGLMLFKEGQVQEGTTIVEDVATRAAEQGHLSLHWRALCDLAHSCFTAGDRDQARAFAANALEVIDTLADDLEDPEAFRRAAALQLPAALRQRPARSPDSPLTTREAEIAGLIAQGLTNREIADRLVVSSRTVETHVANAMAKLAFGSRAQLAAWYTEQSHA